MGNRAGVMAMGNVVAVFLFAGRNNILLYITDWSHSTYLLLHRWFGYWAIFHTIVHSFMELGYYILEDGYEAERVQLYWIWGIVGTVAVSAIVPFSLLWVRQHYYEVFLASHIVLALLFIIGYYYHIWFVFEYRWGYEIWIFVAAGLWAVERLARVVRTVWQGLRWANITKLDQVDGEYLRIEVEGKCLDGGVVYLGFPTLTWRFWETHPFSVAYAIPAGSPSSSTQSPPAASPTDKPGSASEQSSGSIAPQARAQNTTVFYARTRGGMTSALAALAAPSARLRVFLEGPYHHTGHIAPQLAHCTDTLCIAGGVGITACLPFLRRSLPAAESTVRLFWSSRHEGLVTALAPVIDSLPGSVEVETVVGGRLKLAALLAREMVAGSGSPLAIVVCGPPGMADVVRSTVVEIARTDVRSRPFVLVDEAFSW